jgi:putative DNA primase/helicase
MNILYSALQEQGIPFPREEVTENKFVRWGKNAKYWARKFEGGYVFGDFSLGKKWEVFERNYDYEKCKKEIYEIQKKANEEKKIEQTKAAIAARQEWNNAKNCETHSYLETKKVKSYGLRINDEKLLIPIHDENANLVSLQSIQRLNNGVFFKKFFPGARKKGCFYVIGEISEELIICEGYATAASIYECIEKPVIIAFDSGNILSVSKTMRRKYPNAKITIAADNDQYKGACNPGIEKAREAAQLIGANVAIPEFQDKSTEPTDFNDLHILEGAEKVRNAFSINKCSRECVLEAQESDGFKSNYDNSKSNQKLLLKEKPKSGELHAFFYNQKNVRTLKSEEKILWILKDVCDALDLSNSRKVADRLDNDEKEILKSNLNLLLDIPNRGLTAVTESGLYKVILQSRKPEARKFERWITHEVLPQIRKHGSYIAPGAEKIQEKNEEDGTETSVPEGFQLTEDALSYYDPFMKNFVVISGHIEVIAHTEDQGSGQTGKLVKFITHNGEVKQLRLQNNMIIKDGDAIHQILAAQGLFVSTRKRLKNKLSEYINASNPKQYAKIIRVSGWYENCFITENGIIGEIPDKLLIFQPDSEPTATGTKGNLEDWIENVGKLCTGNSRLILAVSAAFASVLLYPCRRENFGLHFVGNSSEGKSTALYVAASVFGSRKYLRSWRSTDNGLEGIAATHNDMLLILDELGAADPRKAGDISYMFNSGQGKTRANIIGAARKPHTWRIGVLSSGEKDLETHMAEANKKMQAGQGLRLIPVFAKPTPESSGLLEKLNGFNSLAALAQHLDKATQKYYGAPMVAFVENVIRETDSVHKYFEDALRDSKEKHLPGGASGQDDRVFKIFFTIGFAGELATRYGVTGWPAGEALTAAIDEFGRWISHKGGFGNQEEKQMLEQIRYFFSTYAQSKFQKIVRGKTFECSNISERAGFTETRTNADGSTEDLFYVFPEYFKNVIAKGLSLKIVSKLLIDQGIMETKQAGERTTTVISIDGKLCRMYVINSKIFE